MDATPIAAPHTSQNGLEAQEWVSCDSYKLIGRRVVVRTTYAEFAVQVRRLFRSFLSLRGDGLFPDLLLSFCVPTTRRSHTLRPFHFVYRGYSEVGRTTRYWQLFRFL